MQVATVIGAQLGGRNRLEVMIGAYNFFACGNSFGFRFKGCPRVNFCRIDYLPGPDLYRMVLLKYPNVDPVVEYENIYCDQLVELFEDDTGLFLSL